MHSAIKVAKHFVDRANEEGVKDMTLLKLMKITYIAHGWMLGICGRTLFSENVEAWQYGPVIPELYHETKQFGRKAVTHLPAKYDFVLDADEEAIIQQCFDNYSGFTAGQLVALTHDKNTPWDLTVRKMGHGPGVVIPSDTIEAYYAQRVQNAAMKENRA